jgi:hypothetical protein
MPECQNTIIAGPASVRVAPLGETKANATVLGFTNGGVTITPNVTKTAIRVDQGKFPVRYVPTEAELTVSIPLASITLPNIEKAFNMTLADGTGLATFTDETYYQLWIDTKGPVNNSGVKADREYYFAKVSFNSTDGLVLSRTDQQTLTLEAAVVNCPDENGIDTGYASVTDTYDESES